MPLIKMKIEGADQVIQALRKLPADVQDVAKREAKDIATSLADWMKADARRSSRQGARASSSVREGSQGFWPVVTASNTGKARGLLFGSIFGMKRHSGWYAHRRYHGSKGHQFGAYIGFPGYWFFSTAEQRQPWIESEWHKAADKVIREAGL